MNYISLFDLLENHAPPESSIEYVPEQLSKGLHYNGKLSSIIEGLQRALHEKETVSALRRRILHPPRILRGLLDYRLEHPELDPEGDLVRETLDMTTATYRGEERTIGLLDKLQHHFPNNLLASRIKHRSDKVTAAMMSPHYTRLVTTDLRQATGDANILLLAMAHGGVATGLDLFLRYTDTTGNKNSTFYTTRFSTRKQGDETPRLLPAEATWLERQAEGRHIVIYDEDFCSGKTLAAAYRFFGSEMFAEKPIILATNNTEPNTFMSRGYHSLDTRPGREAALRHMEEAPIITEAIATTLRKAAREDESGRLRDLAATILTRLEERGEPV